MTYTISKGKHYPDGWGFPGYALGGIHSGMIQNLTKTVTFDASCLMLPEDLTCRNDWNKLFGWSYGAHHRNSLRIGWRVMPEGKIRIAMYLYENGIRRSRGFASIDTDKAYDISITHYHDTGDLIFRVRSTTYDRQWNDAWRGCKPCTGYFLGLYHGGNCTAPQTMLISML